MREFGLRPFHHPLGLARLSRRSIKRSPRAALRFASALAAACLAGAAYANSIPLMSRGPAQPSAEFVEAPAGAGSLPADPSSLINPIPASLQPFIDEPLRAQAPPPSAAPAPGPFGFLSSTWQSQNLLGDMWGLRPALSKYGVTLSIVENAETFGNLTGGVKQGFEANGLTTVAVQVDTGKAFGLNGGTFNVSGLEIWGGDLTDDNLLVLQTATGIEANVAVRLWELWYQQKFTDKFDIKVGEQSLDQEFMISQNSGLFLELDDGLADASQRGSARRRPRLPARGLRRSRSRAGDGRRHRARGRLQRQPDPEEFAKLADQQSQWRELPAQHRHFRDRRTAIRNSGTGRAGEGDRRVQDRRLVRQL